MIVDWRRLFPPHYLDRPGRVGLLKGFTMNALKSSLYVRSRAALLIGAALCGGLLAGCSDKTAGASNKDAAKPANPVVTSSTVAGAASTAATGQNSATADTDGSTKADAGETQGAKMQLYIECYNASSDSLGRSLHRYASWVQDLAVGPTGTERNVYGLYEVNDAEIQKCHSNIAQAEKMQPAMPELDQAATAYDATIGPLSKTIAEIYPYYQRQNYKDDNFAKGKQMNKPLAEQGKAFEIAEQKFSSALDQANDQLTDARLKKMEKSGGHNLDYLQMATMADAKGLLRLLSKDDFPIDQASAKIDAFEKLIDEMQANKEEKPAMWSMFISKVDAFRNAAKARMRRVRDKTPYTTGEQALIKNDAGEMVDGTSDKLSDTYNSMIETANSLPDGPIA
jgi:Protein of unknown function (DUF3829)